MTTLQLTILRQLTAAIEESTGKKVTKVVVHYDDKTQDTLREETSEKRKARRTEARNVRREARNVKDIEKTPGAKAKSVARNAKAQQ